MAQGARILVVDDEPAILRTVGSNLRAHDFRVETAETAQEALERFERFQADVVLVDLVVPGRHGREVIRAIREHSGVPIIVLSARGAVERENPSLKGVLPEDYARPALDKQRLGQLIDFISNIQLGGRDIHAGDILGRVYDPCCDSSGMFVQSEVCIRSRGERLEDISIYGQELNYTTWRLAKINLATKGMLPKGHAHFSTRSKDVLGLTAVGVAR